MTEPTADPHDLTEMAGTAEADTQSAYAWGEADDAVGVIPEPRGWVPSLVTSAVVMASLAIVGAAAAVAYHHLRDVPEMVVVTAPTPSTTSLTVVTPPTASTSYLPPKPIQSTSPGGGWAPVPARPAPPIESADEVHANNGTFISLMRADGWYISNPSAMVHTARQFCTALRQGVSPTELNQRIASDNGLGMGSALIFTANAMIAYPGCRFGAGR